MKNNDLKMQGYSAGDCATARDIYRKLYDEQVDIKDNGKTFPFIPAEVISEKLSELEKKVKDTKHPDKGAELAKKMILIGYDFQKWRLTELDDVWELLEHSPGRRDIL